MKYLMTADIGNTNTVFGLFENEKKISSEPVKHWRTVTRRDRTSDELGLFLTGFLQSAGITPGQIESCIYSSVVPSFNPIVERMSQDFFKGLPVRVTYDMKLPLTFAYPHPYEVGPDRIVNAVAVSKLYKTDAIIIDLGTATTFCLLHGNSYEGGSIAPGLKLSIEALSNRAAMLPPIEFVRPDSGVLGDTTVHSIQSGFFYGWIGLLKEIIHRMKELNPSRKYQVISTGGLANTILQEEPHIFDVVDPLLTLKGLQEIYLHLLKQ